MYACWKMHVRTPDGALLLLTQYRKSKRLKDLTHECDSFEGCGSYSPTCRLNDRGDLVILFWRFPVLQFVLMLLAAVFLFALALRQLYLFKTWAPFHAAEEDRVALSPRDVQCAEEGSEGSFDETLWDATVHSR